MVLIDRIFININSGSELIYHIFISMHIEMFFYKRMFGSLDVSTIRNARYIEKNFSVCPNKEVIENVRTHVNTYEDSIRYHNEMIQMAAFKDCMANCLFKEANEIKKKINQK